MLNHYLAPPNPTFDCFVEGVPISQRDLETSRCHLWILRHPLRCANKCSWILMSVHDELKNSDHQHDCPVYNQHIHYTEPGHH